MNSNLDLVNPFKNQAAASDANINFEYIFMQFSDLLDQLQDNDLLKPLNESQPLRAVRFGCPLSRVLS